MKKIADPSKMGSAADDKVSHNMKNTLHSAYITCRALTTYLRLTQSREEGGRLLPSFRPLKRDSASIWTPSEGLESYEK